MTAGKHTRRAKCGESESGKIHESTAKREKHTQTSPRVGKHKLTGKIAPISFQTRPSIKTESYTYCQGRKTLHVLPTAGNITPIAKRGKTFNHFQMRKTYTHDQARETLHPLPNAERHTRNAKRTKKIQSSPNEERNHPLQSAGNSATIGKCGKH